jgi:hypothetical protein
MLIFGVRQLLRTIKAFVDYFNRSRPQQGIGQGIVVATNLIHGRNPGDLRVPEALRVLRRGETGRAANENEAELTHSKADLIGEAALHRHQLKQIKRRTTDGQ